MTAYNREQAASDAAVEYWRARALAAERRLYDILRLHSLQGEATKSGKNEN